jgi:replication fork clamp-binding protein CrfC
VSSTPINLKVYSTEVINLTLVDLPGITRVPIGDQPPDIEVQIRNMVLDFIRPHNAVILAVTAGNSDLSNSDALKLARDVDPAGERTLGVITKLDIMDAGTNALSVLTGQVIPLKLGYIGVVNRSQKDIIDNKAVRAALSDEKAYFESHPVYKSIAARCGIPHLARTLQKLLLQHINAFLPTLRARLLDMRTDAVRELELCGPELADDNESSRQVRLLDILTRVADAYKAGLDISDDVDVTELQAGARVNFIFNDVFGVHVAAMDPLQGISDNDIKTCLHNAAGTRPALFIAEAAFELLVRRQIELLRDPAMQCIDLVHEELRRVVGGLDVNALKQFDALRERVFAVFKTHLQLCAERSKAVIGNVVDCELAFININHPDFVGADEVTSRMLKKSLRNKAAANKENGGGDGAAAGAGAAGGAPAFAAKNKAAAKKDEPPQLRRVPGQIRAGSYQTEKEKFEIDVIKTLMVSYFDIVRKRLRDLVPKSAMLFLVQKSQKDMHNVLVRDVYGDVKQTAAFPRRAGARDGAAQRHEGAGGAAE